MGAVAAHRRTLHLEPPTRRSAGFGPIAHSVPDFVLGMNSGSHAEIVAHPTRMSRDTGLQVARIEDSPPPATPLPYKTQFRISVFYFLLPGQDTRRIFGSASGTRSCQSGAPGEDRLRSGPSFRNVVSSGPQLGMRRTQRERSGFSRTWRGRSNSRIPVRLLRFSKVWRTPSPCYVSE